MNAGISDFTQDSTVSHDTPNGAQGGSAAPEDIKTHPLEILSIMHVIASHLSQNDLLSCLRVSEVFHAACISRIWCNIELIDQPAGRAKPMYPSGSSLERHSHHIQEIEFISVFPDEYLALRNCQRLRSITIWTEDAEELPEDGLLALSKLIATHAPSLELIRVTLAYATPAPNFWYAINLCAGLHQLRFEAVQVEREFAALFLHICSRPTSLHLWDIQALDWPMTMREIEDQDAQARILEGVDEGSHLQALSDKEITPWMASKILIVDTRSPQSVPPAIQVEMIRRSPGLKELAWLVSDYDSLPSKHVAYEKALLKSLSQGPWPAHKLETLFLAGSLMVDKLLAKLIDQMQEIKEIRGFQTRFGPLSLRALTRWGIPDGGTLRQLCLSIEALRLGHCESLTSDMTQRLLENCPKLKVLHAGRVTAVDITQGQNWVCRSLKELHVRIELGLESGETISRTQLANMQRAIFARLGRLKRLEELGIGAQIGNSENPQLPPLEKAFLDLRLKAGLRELGKLKQLRLLSFDYKEPQAIGMKDARWMVQHWPQLKQVRGYTNKSWVTRVWMRAFLKNEGVEMVCDHALCVSI